MNASQFMDKQIMELSASGANKENLLDLLNPPEKQRNSGDDSGFSVKTEEILPNYDFQLIRSVASADSTSLPSNPKELPIRSVASPDSTAAPSNPKELNYSSSEANSSLKSNQEKKNKREHDTNMIVEFDRTVKKYADKIMHALEGMSSRLNLIEGRTHDLELSFDELKLAISSNSGSSDGKMRQLENILREVQIGVQVLRDKQEIAEAQIQLSKLQSSESKPNLPPNQQAPPQQLPDALPPPPLPPQTQLPSVPAMPPRDPYFPSNQQAPPQQLPALPPPPSLPPQTQLPSVPAMPPRDPYSPPNQQVPPQRLPSVPAMAPHDPYFPPNQQVPPQQLPDLPPPPSLPPPLREPYFPPNQQAPPHQHPDLPPPLRDPYFPPNQQEPHQQPYHLPPQPQRPPPPPPQLHHPDESSPYISSGPQIYPPSMGPIGPGPGPLPSGYRPGPSSVIGPSSSGYPRLPTAQLLPSQNAPAGSGSNGERVPIDDVVDKVASMGFPRDVVRSTVGRLTENGQNVDLNVVLDKLMNDGENPPQKAWYVH